MTDSRTPAKTDSKVQPPPIPPRPKSALKNKIMISTPKPPHKRTKSDPSPSPGKKTNQQNGVRIDALSPAKKGHVQRSLMIDFEEEAKHGSDSLFFSPPRTPKPTNVPSIIANNRPLSFSGRVAALLLAYDVYGHDSSPDALWQYEQELISFGFSCPKNPVRNEAEGDDEWQRRLEQHKDEVSCHSDYYLLHSAILRKAKGQKSLDQKESPAALSPSPQKIVLEQSTAKSSSPAINVSQQTSLQRSPVTTFDEEKTQANVDYQFNTPKKVVSDIHSINGAASQNPALPKTSSKGFWSFCPCGKEEGEDDMRYSQLSDGPVAKQMK